MFFKDMGVLERHPQKIECLLVLALEDGERF
jgi:hypothetical protein